MTTLITIPFDGFYESSHSAILDDCENNIFQDDHGDLHENAPDDFYNHIDYKKLHEDYSREYLKEFERFFNENCGGKIAFKFEKLLSPREYNFTTDRIFAEITPQAAQWLAAKAWATPYTLARIIKARHMSRDGFASFYSNDLREWAAKPVHDLDHNELETLLIAVMTANDVDMGEDLKAWTLMERARGNGVIDNLLWGAMSEEGKKIANDFREAA